MLSLQYHNPPPRTPPSLPSLFSLASFPSFFLYSVSYSFPDKCAQRLLLVLGDILADSALSTNDRQCILLENLPLRSAHVYIALPYIKPCIFMHSVPVAVLTVEETGNTNPRPKGLGAAPFLAIDIHYSRSTEAESASRPLGTEALYVLISVGNKDFLLS